MTTTKATPSGQFGPQSDEENGLEPGDRRDLSACSPRQDVLDSGAVQAGLPTDGGDAPALEAVTEPLGDLLGVERLHGSVRAQLPVGPLSAAQILERGVAAHTNDGRAQVLVDRGWQLCDTPASVSGNAGISRQDESGIGVEVAMPVETGVVTWIARPNVEQRTTSKVDMTRRDRSTVLICRALAGDVSRPVGLAALYRELVGDSGPSAREMHVKATTITLAAAYLVDRPTGEQWAFVAGERMNPADVSFKNRVDAIGYCDGDDWTIDVVSVAVRPGQLTADLSGGRVMRCVRAVERLIVPGGTASIRVWSHQAQTPRLAATVHVVPVGAPVVMSELAS